MITQTLHSLPSLCGENEPRAPVNVARIFVRNLIIYGFEGFRGRLIFFFFFFKKNPFGKIAHSAIQLGPHTGLEAARYVGEKGRRALEGLEAGYKGL